MKKTILALSIFISYAAMATATSDLKNEIFQSTNFDKICVLSEDIITKTMEYSEINSDAFTMISSVEDLKKMLLNSNKANHLEQKISSFNNAFDDLFEEFNADQPEEKKLIINLVFEKNLALLFQTGCRQECINECKSARSDCYKLITSHSILFSSEFGLAGAFIAAAACESNYAKCGTACVQRCGQ